ncbi:hypothetical protein CTEN210_07226 [Chaetoceros tenuissimus]|uniref:Uncharacterized protein n=1 Tax=Chaetoceros tenuissimus TaxID=426638 RepID=A0AAD3H547_9STRA|nr:hypothetical protein CTEN210_07226 [Chaetoceros tenuissimus]
MQESFAKLKSLLKRIEDTIVPAQEEELWFDDDFFIAIREIIVNGDITEENVSRIVAEAFFRLKFSCNIPTSKYYRKGERVPWFIRNALIETKTILSKIEHHILPLQEKQLWKDELFFQEMREIISNGSITNNIVSKAVANALFRIRLHQPSVSVVKDLIQAFPDALAFRNAEKYLPIQYLVTYPEGIENADGTHYILPLALEGMKHNIGGENMRGGLLNVFWKQLNLLQILSASTNDDKLRLNVIKNLRSHGLLKKEDIVRYSLLYYSCLGKSSFLRFQYFLAWDPQALAKTRLRTLPLLHSFILPPLRSIRMVSSPLEADKCFKRCLQHSLEYFNALLFQKDHDGGKTAFELAIEKFGETPTMILLREVFTEEAGHSLLHEVILHQRNRFNLFLSWFPRMYRLRDENGNMVLEVLFISGIDILKKNPALWVNPNEAEKALVANHSSAVIPSAAVARRSKRLRTLNRGRSLRNGIYFCKDNGNQSEFESDLASHGEARTFDHVRKVINERDEFPLLHQIIEHEPNYFNLFLSWFPWAYHTRDDQGRSVMQILLSTTSGRDLLKKNPALWTTLKWTQLEEKDPLTSLIPFVAIASGNDGILNLSYQFLRQHPPVL